MRGTNKLPSWKDLSPPNPSPHFKKLWGFQYDDKDKEFRGWFAGDRLRKWVGPPFEGGRLRDLAPPSNYEQLLKYLTKVISVPQIQRTSGHLFATDGLFVSGERIALPMAQDGRIADGVFGASDYISPPLLGPAELIYENVEWYAI